MTKISTKKRTGMLDSDGKATRFFGMAWQLLILNLMTLLCCLPVVTAGASLVAMYYVILKLIRGEESYVARDFFHAFKSEFKQAAVLWVIKLAFLLPFAVDLLMLEFAPETLPTAVAWVVIIVGFAAQILLIFTLPLESHFDNTTAGILENSLRLGISRLPRAIVMAFIYLVPAWLLIHVLLALPLVLMFGLSLPGFVCMKLADPVFRQFEPEKEGTDPAEGPEQ